MSKNSPRNKHTKTDTNLPKFKLNKETVKELDFEELSLVQGGATFSCCVGCATDGSQTHCSNQGSSC